MVGAQVLSMAVRPTAPAADWTVAAVDNLPDEVEPNIVFQQGTSVYEWTLDGLDLENHAALSMALPKGWTVVGPR